jgi:hypothetical protein
MIPLADVTFMNGALHVLVRRARVRATIERRRKSFHAEMRRSA